MASGGKPNLLLAAPGLQCIPALRWIPASMMGWMAKLHRCPDQGKKSEVENLWMMNDELGPRDS